MKIRNRRRSTVGVVVLCVSLWLSGAVPALAWRPLDEGLWLGEFQPPTGDDGHSPGIVVLRIDPEHYSLTLLSSSERGVEPLKPGEWADRFGLTALINASMYQEDRKTSTGYMQNYDHMNNPSVNRRFGAFLAFNPKDASVPPVQIIERGSPGWKNRLGRYDSLVQNYRMIGEGGENLWQPSGESYSIAAVGIDRHGDVLFIHSRAAYTVNEFNEILLSLPLELDNAMYVEGGPQACLFINTEELHIKWNGVIDNGFLTDSGLVSTPLPNVLGIVKTPPTPADQ